MPSYAITHTATGAVMSTVTNTNPPAYDSNTQTLRTLNGGAFLSSKPKFVDGVPSYHHKVVDGVDAELNPTVLLAEMTQGEKDAVDALRSTSMPQALNHVADVVVDSGVPISMLDAPFQLRPLKAGWYALNVQFQVKIVGGVWNLTTGPDRAARVSLTRNSVEIQQWNWPHSTVNGAHFGGVAQHADGDTPIFDLHAHAIGAVSAVTISRIRIATYMVPSGIETNE